MRVDFRSWVRIDPWPILRKSLVTFAIVACLMGFTNKTKVDVVRDMTADVKAKPAVVYVMDFDLDVDMIQRTRARTGSFQAPSAGGSGTRRRKA